MILVAGFHITTLFIVVWLCFSGKLSNKIFHSNSKLTFLKHLASLPFDVLHFQIVHSSTKINIHVACDPNISNFRLQLSIQWNFTFFKQLHLKRTKLAVFFFLLFLIQYKYLIPKFPRTFYYKYRRFTCTWIWYSFKYHCQIVNFEFTGWAYIQNLQIVM